MMHQECCNWKGGLMCVVVYLWEKFAAGCCCSVGKKGWASRRRSTYWSFKSLGFDEGTEVGLTAWWWFEGCLEWRGDCWKVESSQVGLWPTCWHAKPAEGMIVGMILPQSTLIRFISHEFLWHVVPILWCDRRWQKQPSPNEPWLLQISSRLASTKEVDLKSKVQQEFYRNERKRQGHSAIVECHIHNWQGHQTWNFVPGKPDPFHHARVTFSHDMPSVGI